jgi:hydroxyacylglutathione hydrolase
MLSVDPIKAYDDNYIWLISTNEGSIVVDPGESEKIIKAIDENRIDLKGILITHHHYDHTNGLKDLLEKNEFDVYGPINNINGINKKVGELDKFSIIGIEFEVIEIPGHTLDHIAFYSFNKGSPVLFCGDTLFAGGCGRVFEGTYEQMFEALKKISKFPKNTKIYCGHEYTLSNIKFALEVDPNNEKLQSEFEHVQSLIKSNTPSLPTTIEKELDLNPFLRCDNLEIQKNIINRFNVGDNEFEIFTAIRKWKDNY